MPEHRADGRADGPDRDARGAEGEAVADAVASERRRLRTLRRVALVEGTTLIVLIAVAVPLRHLGGVREATQIVGSLHGLVFLAYLWLTVAVVSDGGFARRDAARLLLAALVPFGGFLGASWLRRREAAL